MPELPIIPMPVVVPVCVDKVLTCRDCSAPYTWTAGEQRWYAKKQLTPSPRCSECRAKKKASWRCKFCRQAAAQNLKISYLNSANVLDVGLVEPHTTYRFIDKHATNNGTASVEGFSVLSRWCSLYCISQQIFKDFKESELRKQESTDGI